VDVIIDEFVDISCPHIVQVIVVLDDLALDVSWKQVEELGIVRGCDQSIVATSEEKHINVSQLSLEVSSVVEGRVVLSVDGVVGGSGTVIKLLEVATADHLHPMQEVLG